MKHNLSAAWFNGIPTIDVMVHLDAIKVWAQYGWQQWCTLYCSYDCRHASYHDYHDYCNEIDYVPYMIDQILLSNRRRSRIVAAPEQALNDPSPEEVCQYLHIAVDCSCTRAGAEWNRRLPQMYIDACHSWVVAALSDGPHMVTESLASLRTIGKLCSYHDLLSVQST